MFCLGFPDVGPVRPVAAGVAGPTGRCRRWEEMEREAPPAMVDFTTLLMERLDVLLDGVMTARYWEVPDRQLRACLDVPKGTPAGMLEIL